jgi:hypothetical protein
MILIGIVFVRIVISIIVETWVWTC